MALEFLGAGTMTQLIGDQLEALGYELFKEMGLICFRSNTQVQLLSLDPGGSYSTNEHLEFDYLVPYGDYCLIGEMKGTNNSKSAKIEYQTFKRHYNWFSNISRSDDIWKQLGIPEAELHRFRNIKHLRGFFILPYLQKFDVDISDVPNIACLYKTDWDLLTSYAKTIGSYAGPHLLHSFNVTKKTDDALLITRDMNQLMTIPYKNIASNVAPASVFTFVISPYKILPMAQVYRRDELPDLAPDVLSDFQRPLLPAKLHAIRANLLKNPDFMFPSNVLVILTEGCKYDEKDGTLVISKKYGSISVIDGQHRLFAYANQVVENLVGENSNIMVTAIRFNNTDKDSIQKYSARTFIEINTNQTRVDAALLLAIGYELLGLTDPKYLAAQTILKVNRTKGSLYGLFDTNQTRLGVISATTVMSSVRSLTNLNTIERIYNAKRGSLVQLREGYINLFEVSSVEDLRAAETLVSKAAQCLIHYFNDVKFIFHHDWPNREKAVDSSFVYAKVISAFVKLLQSFLDEGKNWSGVKAELELIRGNVMELRRSEMKEYNQVLFSPHHTALPNAQWSEHNTFLFLKENRIKPTTIQEATNQQGFNGNPTAV